MKRLLPVLVFGAFFAFIIYQRNPGVKAKVDNALREQIGWNEEARKADPKGFIEHAIEQLKQDKATFTAQRSELAKVRDEATENLTKAEANIAKGNELAAAAKAAYQTAESGEAWPAKFSNSTYTRDQLIQQVSTIMAEKKAYEETVKTYKEVLDGVNAQEANLMERITKIDGKVIELGAQAKLVEMKKLTAEADVMLAQVNDLLVTNFSDISEVSNSQS